MVKKSSVLEKAKANLAKFKTAMGGRKASYGGGGMSVKPMSSKDRASFLADLKGRGPKASAKGDLK